jgi:Starch-binding associating with outer membrane
MKLYSKLLLGAALLSFTSCTEDFEEMNVNPNQPAKATAAQLFATAQYNFATNISDEWNNGRMGMLYSQYWSSTYYTDESRYLIRESVNQTMWNNFYANVLKELQEGQDIDAATKLEGYENRMAIAEIFKAMTFHYLSDIYGGPIPYTEALGAENATPKYNTGEEVYQGLLKTLEEQIAILDASKSAYQGSGDIVYGDKKGFNQVTLWKKFANSLRLRIALRMIDAKPQEAQEAIRKALDPANGGIISSNEESARINWVEGAPNNNPMNQAFKTRQDFSVSAPFVNYLQKYSDPRLAVYAQPLSTDPNQYVGEEFGLKQGAGSNGDQTKVSLPGTYALAAKAPTTLLDYAEVEFMLAEIVARGLNVGVSGTAEDHYKAGIKASFDFAGLSQAAYTAYLAKVPYVAGEWKDAIGSQKWIAMYTQGIQAWLERLRLDFEDPYTGEDIFVAPAAGSRDPNVTLVPFRMTYPVTEASLNGANYQEAVKSIGGTNSKGVKAWWDKF